MNATSISREWARFAGRLTIDRLPAHVVELASLRTLDALSTALAGVGLPVPTVATTLVGDNSGPATLLGSRRGVPAVDAALVNATLINGRTQDDFLCKSHPGAVTVPAALAVGEQFGGSGADFLAAIVVGYEIVGRVYLGGPGMLPRLRATGVAGTIAAAAAAARMMRLDEDRTVHALGCAAVFAHGFGAGFLTGTMDVKLNVGMACRSGVTAALLAHAGATATDLAFEGSAGFYEAMANGTDDVAAATRGLGERHLIEDTVYKEYPICIFAQTPVALALQIGARPGFAPEDIRRVTVTVPEPTYSNPGFVNLPPYRSALQARVSARFCIAAALLGRPIGSFDYYDRVDDAEVLALGDRIELVSDGTEGEAVRVTVNSETATFEAAGTEGATLHPTRDKVVAKFDRLVTPLRGERTEALRDAVLGLATRHDLRHLTSTLRDLA